MADPREHVTCEEVVELVTDYSDGALSPADAARFEPGAWVELGFIAARIAEERGGVAAYHAERARQQAWLAARLGLEPTRPRAH